MRIPVTFFADLFGSDRFILDPIYPHRIVVVQRLDYYRASRAIPITYRVETQGRYDTPRNDRREARGESFIPKQLALALRRAHHLIDHGDAEIRFGMLSFLFIADETVMRSLLPGALGLTHLSNRYEALRRWWYGKVLSERSAGYRCAYRKKPVDNRDHTLAADPLLTLHFPADVNIDSSMVTHCKSTIGPQTALVHPQRTPHDSTFSTLHSPLSLLVAF
jgi:hypothetical protein